MKMCWCVFLLTTRYIGSIVFEGTEFNDKPREGGGDRAA